MKLRIAVPDGLLNPDSKTPQYQTGVAETDSFVHAFDIGRAMAQRYGHAFLLTEDCLHVMLGWRKRDDDEDYVEFNPVATGMFIDRHIASSMNDTTPRVGAPGGGCPQCILVALSVERGYAR